MTEDTSRRTFTKAALASLAFPYLLPQRAKGANDRIRVGVIGVGNRSGLLIDQLPDGAEIVAVADCHRKRMEDAAANRKANWRIYEDHRELLWCGSRVRGGDAIRTAHGGEFRGAAGGAGRRWGALRLPIHGLARRHRVGNRLILRVQPALGF
jgi:hypothetical protein